MKTEAHACGLVLKCSVDSRERIRLVVCLATLDRRRLTLIPATQGNKHTYKTTSPKTTMAQPQIFTADTNRWAIPRTPDVRRGSDPWGRWLGLVRYHVVPRHRSLQRNLLGRRDLVASSSRSTKKSMSGRAPSGSRRKLAHRYGSCGCGDTRLQCCLICVAPILSDTIGQHHPHPMPRRYVHQQRMQQRTSRSLATSYSSVFSHWHLGTESFIR
jgi:hypothetical protein